jgi:hypothetical protein
VLAGVALDGQTYDVAGSFLGAGPGFVHNPASEMAGVAQGLLFHFLEEKRAGFGFGDVSELREFFPALLQRLGELVTEFLNRFRPFLHLDFLIAERLFLAHEIFELPVQKSFPLIQALLGGEEFLSALREGLLGPFPHLEDFLVRGKARLPKEDFRFTPGVFQHGFFLQFESRAELPAFPTDKPETQQAPGQKSTDGQNRPIRNIKRQTHSKTARL